MAKVKKVIAGVKGRQEINNLVIMTADAKGYFCGKLSSWEAIPVELIAWKRGRCTLDRLRQGAAHYCQGGT